MRYEAGSSAVSSHTASGNKKGWKTIHFWLVVWNKKQQERAMKEELREEMQQAFFFGGDGFFFFFVVSKTNVKGVCATGSFPEQWENL